jgi:hypothetical protein
MRWPAAARLNSQNTSTNQRPQARDRLSCEPFATRSATRFDLGRAAAGGAASAPADVFSRMGGDPAGEDFSWQQGHPFMLIALWRGAEQVNLRAGAP